MEYNKQRRPAAVAEMPDELVLEILLRLPMRSLLWFKFVCQAWHATISDPSFIRKQLQHSASKHEREPSFLITPHTLDSVIGTEARPTTFSNNVGFYQWQEGQDITRLVHSTDFHGEFRSVYGMSHCDGLVTLPIDTKAYVLNPATGDVLKLPYGRKDEVSLYWYIDEGLLKQSPQGFVRFRLEDEAFSFVPHPCLPPSEDEPEHLE